MRLRATDRMGIAVTLAVVLAAFTLRHLTSDNYLVPASVLVVLLAVITVVARRVHLASLLVVAIQIAFMIIALLVYAKTLLPDGHYWAGLAELYPAAIEHMRTQAAPMEPNPGVRFLLVSTVLIIGWLTDLLAVTLHRTVWTFAPLLTLYLVPALGLTKDVGVASFVLVAIGYIAILAVEGVNTTNRWTRGLTHDSLAGIGDADPVVLRATALIGVPALVLALIGGMLVPTLGYQGWGLGPAGGDGPIQLTNPVLDLKRNLTLPVDKVAYTYRTTQPGGSYMRLASLPVFTRDGWGNSGIKINTGRLPTAPGLTVQTGRAQQFDISVTQNWQTTYLLAPYAPTSFTAKGSWGYDPASLVILSTERGRNDALSGQQYQVMSTLIEPSAAELAQQVGGTPVDSQYTDEVPADLPQPLRQLAREVTKDAQTDAAKAAAIQSYLRDPNRFTYSTGPLPGTGYEALQNFLLKDHTGYCEQFAAAMAMMARVVGIPSRVAVGFLPGTREGSSDRYQVTLRQLHAWPELYFTGYGWVRWEPTPGIASAPSWSNQNPSGPSSSAPTAAPGSTATDTPTTRPTRDPGATESAPADPQANQTDHSAGWVVAALLGGAVAILMLLSVPALLRIRRRSGRIRLGDGAASERVSAAWDELRDTRVDLHAEWPSGSPRSIAARVSDDLPSQDRAAMGQLAVLVERARYSHDFDRRADPSEIGKVAALVTQLRRGLASPYGWRSKLRAIVVPRSLWNRPPRSKPTTNRRPARG